MSTNIPNNQDSTFDVSSAAEMEALERELVIEDSVDSVVRYAEEPLSDEEIEARKLDEEEIVPDSGPIGGLETKVDE